MKGLFQSKGLHLTVCLLLAWKGISLFLWLLLEESGILGAAAFFWSTGFTSALALIMAAGFAESQIAVIVPLVLLGVLTLVYWIFFTLLAVNRKGANAASIVLLILCALDFPFTFACSLAAWWSLLLCALLHMAIFITVAMMRRSRPGAPTPLTEIPDSI